MPPFRYEAWKDGRLKHVCFTIYEKMVFEGMGYEVITIDLCKENNNMKSDIERVAECGWPGNMLADRHDITGKWVLHYLTDEQAAKCLAALQHPQAQQSDHSELERRAEEYLHWLDNKHETHPDCEFEELIHDLLSALKGK